MNIDIILSFLMTKYISGRPVIWRVMHCHAKKGISFSIDFLLQSIICFLSNQNLEVIGPMMKLSRSSNVKEEEDLPRVYSLARVTSYSSKSSFSIWSSESSPHALLASPPACMWLWPWLWPPAPPEVPWSKNEGIRLPRYSLLFRRWSIIISRFFNSYCFFYY